MRKPSLADIAVAAGSARRVPPAAPAADEPAPAAGARAGGRAPSRAATRQIAGHFPAEVAWQLRALAVSRRSTVQDLLGEALNDLFQKHGRPEIVPAAARRR